MKRYVFIFCLAMLSMMSTSSANADEAVLRTTIYRSGNDGYHTYRIPSILRAKDGSILAFAEGRRNAGGDAGEINLLLKRSTDDGKTFGPMKVVWADGANTCGNPCPVLDEETGAIWPFSTHNLGTDHEKDLTVRKTTGTRTIWVMRSDDHGKTWSKPTEITSDVKKPSWTWYATGPGLGIQLKRGPHKGRLVIPCDHVTPDTDPAQGNSHVFYSDDHGKTWTLGGEPPDAWFNESQAVELSDGRLMLNMRMHKVAATAALPKARGVAISDDGGQSFVSDRIDDALPDPRCQASIFRYSWPEDGKSRILFSNCTSITSQRKGLSVRISYDEAQTWAATKEMTKGWTAYSSLIRFANDDIGVFYEAGEEKNYERIELARFNLAWLTDGKDAGTAGAQ